MHMDLFAAHVDFTTGSLRLMVHYAHYLTCRRNPPVAANEALEKRQIGLSYPGNPLHTSIAE